jgi:hypothetical protein
MNAEAREYCDACGEPLGSCSCAASNEPAISRALGRDLPARDELRELGAHAVIVAGRWARIIREGDGYAVYFEGSNRPPFRASGLPSEVLALIEAHLREADGNE